jgi:hypothetical protein
MGIIQKISNVIKRYIIKRAAGHKAIDIVEVRTKQLGLLSVLSETDLCIKNSFFLPYTLISIKTNLLNKDGLRVGKMLFDTPTKVKGNSELIFTTTSEISIITSLFQALSNLLSQPIWMRSVGIATVKVLWFTVELPVDDIFEIHPSKLKVLKEETEEEKTIRLQKEAAWKEKYNAEKEKRKIEREVKRSEWKEELLKRKYKENYIPKEQRMAVNNEPLAINDDNDNLKIEFNENLVNTDIPEPRIDNIADDELNESTEQKED